MAVKRTPVTPATKRSPKKAKRKTARSKARSPARTPAKKPTKAKKKKQPPKPTKRQLLQDFRQNIKSDVAEVMDLEFRQPKLWVSTGSLELDMALLHIDLDGKRHNGIPLGRVCEVYGPGHIGKSTLLDHLFANVQRMGGIAVLAETDTGRDSTYTSAIGVNLDELQRIEFKANMGSIENAGDKLVESMKFWNEKAPELPVIVGLDALGVTPTQEEIKKGLTEKSTASAAKIVRVLCRKVAPLLPGSNVTLIVLNHEYKSITFGGGVSANKTYGGQGFELLSTARIKLYPVKDGWLKGPGGVVVGRITGFDLQKWKLGKAYTHGRYGVLSSYGIDNAVTLWDTLTRAKIIEVKGSWGGINVDGEVVKFQGWWGLRQKGIEHPDLFSKLVEIYWGQAA